MWWPCFVVVVVCGVGVRCIFCRCMVCGEYHAFEVGVEFFFFWSVFFSLLVGLVGWTCLAVDRKLSHGLGSQRDRVCARTESRLRDSVLLLILLLILRPTLG
mgnify:CR=1 FL=1